MSKGLNIQFSKDVIDRLDRSRNQSNPIREIRTSGEGHPRPTSVDPAILELRKIEQNEAEKPHIGIEIPSSRK